MSEDSEFRVTRITNENLIVHSQVAWIYFAEGPVELAVKVLINPETGRHFISLPRFHRRGGSPVQLVRYPDSDVWANRVRELLRAFRLSEYCK
jgi:hypothetical protein